MLLMEALRQVCICEDPDTTPPTSWCDGPEHPRIPHHCDCPLYVIELPPVETAPNARTDALACRERLLAEHSGSSTQDHPQQEHT